MFIYLKNKKIIASSNVFIKNNEEILPDVFYGPDYDEYLEIEEDAPDKFEAEYDLEISKDKFILKNKKDSKNTIELKVKSFDKVKVKSDN
jgi:hypothetical protein